VLLLRRTWISRDESEPPALASTVNGQRRQSAAVAQTAVTGWCWTASAARRLRLPRCVVHGLACAADDCIVARPIVPQAFSTGPSFASLGYKEPKHCPRSSENQPAKRPWPGGRPAQPASLEPPATGTPPCTECRGAPPVGRGCWPPGCQGSDRRRRMLACLLGNRLAAKSFRYGVNVHALTPSTTTSLRC
jgi:hypothetical protein